MRANSRNQRSYQGGYDHLAGSKVDTPGYRISEEVGSSQFFVMTDSQLTIKGHALSCPCAFRTIFRRSLLPQRVKRRGLVILCFFPAESKELAKT